VRSIVAPVASFVVALATPALAAPTTSTEDAWLASLTDRVIEDITRGKPLVAEVHVPLCDNTIIRCGNAKLGDGDSLDGNLLWTTTPGFGAWFVRRGTPWKRVARHRTTGHPDVLAIDVYRRKVSTPAAWRKRGAPTTFEVDLVIRAWRGKAIDTALAQYAKDVSGGPAREVVLDDKTTLHAGGAAQLVAWVGHNRLMDLDTAYAWPKPGAAVTGTIAIACHTAAYMEAEVSGSTRVPLLMTRDLLFANAAPLEATVMAFATGQGYAKIRMDASTAYAAIRERPVEKIVGAFTNPSDRRWKRR
jgi:hypothetical protein